MDDWPIGSGGNGGVGRNVVFHGKHGRLLQASRKDGTWKPSGVFGTHGHSLRHPSGMFQPTPIVMKDSLGHGISWVGSVRDARDPGTQRERMESTHGPHE